MTNRERFLAVCRGEKPDYMPIFGFHDAPGMSAGAMEITYNNLLKSGMPDCGGNWTTGGTAIDLDGWYRYWGTCSPSYAWAFPGTHGGWPGCSGEDDGDYTVLTYETGAVTRQLKQNDVTYAMPEFVEYHVRDRASWQYYKERFTPHSSWSEAQLAEYAAQFADSQDPVCIRVNSSWGEMRELMGPVEACTVLYDDPELAKEILDWLAWQNRTFYFPLIRAVKPDIVMTSEDICYNGGMFISPNHFNEFCAPMYRELTACCREAGVTVVAVDSDGFVEELIPILEECGVNALFPLEVKAGNDLFRIRENHPNFILLGGLEKECVNAGNEGMIRDEILSKVPALLEKGYYFPNGDHGIQPMVTFPNLCAFMTLLHDVCGNPKGEYPKQ